MPLRSDIRADEVIQNRFRERGPGPYAATGIADDQSGAGFIGYIPEARRKPVCNHLEPVPYTRLSGPVHRSNGTATLVALKIYSGSKNKYYLDWGLKFYNWMMRNQLDSATGVISNDKKLDGSVNKTFWTYNTGFMLEASVMLYHFTGDKKYLAEAQSLAAAAYRYFGNKTGNGKVSMLDMPWFVVVLFRGYEALYEVDGNPDYLNVIAQNVNDAWMNKDRHGLLSKNWYGHSDDPAKPKWLLDESCMVEFYARLAVIKKGRHPAGGR